MNFLLLSSSSSLFSSVLSAEKLEVVGNPYQFAEEEESFDEKNYFANEWRWHAEKMREKLNLKNLIR